MNLKSYLRGLGLGFIVAGLVLGVWHFTSHEKTMTDAQIRERAAELGMVDANARLTDEDLNDDAEALLESIDDKTGDSSLTDPLSEPVTETGEADAPAYDDPDAMLTTELPTAESLGLTDSDNNGTDGSDSAEPASGEGSDTDSDAGSASGTDGAAEGSDGAGSDAAAGNAADDRQSGDAGSGSSTAVAGTIQIVSGDSSDRVARKLQDAGVITSAGDFDRYLCAHGYDRRISTGTYSIPEGASDEDIARLITHSR